MLVQKRIGSRTRITARQTELLGILNHLISQGKSPTFEEIGVVAGISRPGAYDQFCALRDKRYVTWTPRKARSLRVLELP